MARKRKENSGISQGKEKVPNIVGKIIFFSITWTLKFPIIAEKVTLTPRHWHLTNDMHPHVEF